MGANDRGKTYITVSAVLVALSTVVVGFRIVARWMRTTLGLDDYVICVSIILAYSMLGEAVFCTFANVQCDRAWLIVHRGPRWRARKTHGRAQYSGEDYLPKGEDRRTSNCGLKSNKQSQCFFANEISYTLLVPSIKISILLLYRRIFTVRSFRIASLITGGLVISWCLAVFITVLLQCRPIALNWNKALEGTCIDPKQFFFGNAISNLLIDVVILALPIPMVLQLQLRLSQKLTVLGIFLLGGLYVSYLIIFVKDKSLRIQCLCRQYYASRYSRYLPNHGYVMYVSLISSRNESHSNSILIGIQTP